MLLKRLEMVGFKSFAERTTVDFVPGVTAVVGPNGSGKSNVTDAVRWVLGEQSAKSLRGGKMEDIIFAGSDSRKPLNFAEVSITLDNEDHFLPIDYNEVCIMRRVYRSGESEYFINKQQCRLKDIVDLLMDSGLGRDSFSIISQGRVDQILNSKPEERRAIFEEAAGVLKYKTRKKKAEVKLEETEENLYRVRDIIHELESQIEPLRIQSSIAQDYLDKKEELEKYEVSLLIYEIEQLHTQWETLKKQLEENRDKEIELSTLIQNSEAEIQELRDKQAALDESIEQLQHILLVTSEELEKIEGRKEVLKERKKNYEKHRTQLEQDIAQGKEKLANLQMELEELSTQQKEIVKVLNEDKTRLKEKQKLLEAYSEDIEEKIESLKSDYIELLNKQATINNDVQHLEQRSRQIQAKRDALADDNKRYIKDRNEILSEKKTLEQDLSVIQEKINQMIHDFREEQKKYEQLLRTYESEEKTYYKALQYVQQAKQRIELLEEMEDDYAGFYQGVKEVLKSRENLTGIEGAVAELIQVDNTYAVAIDIALGTSLQHIVVQTEEDARKAIHFLKKNRYGRATFLPMTVIKPKEIPKGYIKQIQNHPSFVGVAAELLNFNQKYANIVRHLLGNVIVAKDLQGANEIAHIIQYRNRVVTLEGDVVNPGGSMTGGTVKQKTSSLLSRKQELDTLRSKLVEMEKKCAILEKELKDKKQALSSQEEKIEQLKIAGEQFRKQELELNDTLKEITWKESSINEKLSLYDNEDQTLREELENLQRKKEENLQRVHEITVKIKEIDTEIQELSTKRNLDQSKKSELIEQINELKIQIAKKEEQATHIKNQRSDAEKHFEEAKWQLQQNEQDLQLLMDEMNLQDSGESQLQQVAEQKLADKNQTIDLIAHRRQQRLEIQQKYEDLERETKELKRQHKGLSQMVTDEEIKLNRLDVELENRLNILREEYLITYEGAKEKYPLSISYEEAKRKVKLIKLSIEELGTVNLGAIDEYKRVSERYEFLMEQKQDLETAKQTLFQVIDEMDEEMIKRFSESFTRIKTEFDTVFKSLFGGGQAELRLTNPDDLLNTGVEIIAQPPGKKLQNLHLLSGGERALTAIALLFAILKVRPVPFCILDEVEAALDEANVYRFSQYLKHFSKETQFIVITHRKGTMEEADVLYGVTMQESGVSKLVSVRLEDKETVVV